MGTLSKDPFDLNIKTPEKSEPKNYAKPDVLCHTFMALSNLHKLLPNRLVELLQSYQSEEDKEKCEMSEFSGLERILAEHEMPEEINLTPKPSRMHLWQRKTMNNVSTGWKKCNLWKRNTKQPPMCTVVVRWLKKNMQPVEDLKSAIHKLSVFGPIRSVTPCGRQSAIVVFKDITSACKAVSAFQSRTPGTMFHCSWQHRLMSKDVRPSISKNLCGFLKLISFYLSGLSVKYYHHN